MRRVLVLAMMSVAGCASLSERATSQLAGCYQFRWDEGAKALGLPWGVVLYDEPLAGAWPIAQQFANVRRARTATSPTAREDHPLGYWRVTAGDSVEIGYPAGGAGFTLTLAAQGQDLVGTGRAVGDVVAPGQAPGPRPTRTVTAYRVLCEAT